MDPVPHEGPEAMAVDEWLLEAASPPVLRVYRWKGEWASLGYFGKISEARAAISGVSWVRRRTGGGAVDHRADWTYSLAVPVSHPLAGIRGAESYRLIHAALGAALAEEGSRSGLASGGGQAKGAACFENPVCHDLIAMDGRKLAGAGQRRTRAGLLHQGSVAGICGLAESRRRAENFANHLSRAWIHVDFSPPGAVVSSIAGRSYAMDGWTEKY